ncbi:MAG: hypothetical protein Q8M91_00570 [Polaromonas sp.]|nr:hypothetical protein [Polaromonas sp.]
MTHTPLRLSALAVFVALAAGCATSPAPAPASATAAAAPAAAGAVELFMVLPESGRIHAFGDTKNYFDFKKHGENMLTRTKIGEGPGGKTLVFGITPDDVKTNMPSRGEQILAGAIPAGGAFYGEIMRDGRYFLFDSLKDMTDFAAFGEVPYSYTDIGAGPKGETIVMVMNKDSYPKGKPAPRLNRFKAIHAAAK